MQYQKSLIKINTFAEICRTTPRTVRFYEQKGLIKPAYIDPFTKYRFYTEEQARHFLRLRLLHDFHIPLNKLQEVVRTNTVKEALEEELKKFKEAMIEQEREYEYLIRMKAFLYDEDDIGKYLKEETFGPHTLFCRLIKRGAYDETYDYWEDVKKEARKLGVKYKYEYYMFYANRYYNPKDTDIEIGLICEDLSLKLKKQTLPENTYFREMPKTKAITYTYKGPFGYFIILYQHLNEYVDLHHLTKSKVSFDYYLGHQENKKSKYNFLTKICFPIE